MPSAGLREARPRTDRGWVELFAPVVFAVALFLSMIFLPMSLLLGHGVTWGDCAPSGSASDPRWIDVLDSQFPFLVLWPATATVLTLLARRWRALWFAFIGLLALAVAAGLGVQMGGLWNPAQTLLGFSLPPVSPGFLFALAPASVLLLGGVLSVISKYRHSA